MLLMCMCLALTINHQPGCVPTCGVLLSVLLLHAGGTGTEVPTLDVYPYQAVERAARE
jgi:hypothetical protein